MVEMEKTPVLDNWKQSCGAKIEKSEQRTAKGSRDLAGYV